MKQLIKIVAILITVTSCSEDQQNKLSRLGVSLLEGDYKVSYADGEHVKSWIVRDGKVTTESTKGYYYFWAEVEGKKVYVQTPIARTYIEEISD